MRPQRHGVVETLQRLGIASWALIGILLLAAGVLWALAQIREVFPPLVVALVVIYVLNPLVSALERRGVGRLAGSCLTYVLFLAAVLAAGALLVPALVQQGRAFVQDFPHTVERVSGLARRVSGEVEDLLGVSLDVGALLRRGSGLVSAENLGRVGRFLLGAVHLLAVLIVGPIIAFYLLVDLPRLQRSLLRLLPPGARAEVHEVASQVSRAMSGFFRGQLLVALVVGVLSSLGLRLIGLPYWLVVGMVAGFFNIIPLVGPFIGAVPGVIIAAAFKSPIHILAVAAVLTAVQQIDNHFISPNVMRWTVRLHPVTVMVSLLVGATLAGFWGMLLAVPAVASAKVVATHVIRTRLPWGGEALGEEPAGGAPVASTPEPPG